MADNYLEKKMEELRVRRPAAFRHPVKKTAAVFVTDGLSERGSAEVRRLAREGTTAIAFAGLPARQGAALAQATGARHYPVDPADTPALERAIADARAHFAPLPLSVIANGESDK